MFPILSKINPIHAFQTYFLNIHLNTILHLRLGLPSGLFASRFPSKFLYAFLISLMCAICPADLIIYLIFLITSEWLSTNYSRNSSFWNFIQPPVTLRYGRCHWVCYNDSYKYQFIIFKRFFRSLLFSHTLNCERLVKNYQIYLNCRIRSYW